MICCSRVILRLEVLPWNQMNTPQFLGLREVSTPSSEPVPLYFVRTHLFWSHVFDFLFATDFRDLYLVVSASKKLLPRSRVCRRKRLDVLRLEIETRGSNPYECWLPKKRKSERACSCPDVTSMIVRVLTWVLHCFVLSLSSGCLNLFHSQPKSTQGQTRYCLSQFHLAR